MSARHLPASRSAGCHRTLETAAIAGALGGPKGVFGGGVPDGPALNYRLNFLYFTLSVVVSHGGENTAIILRTTPRHCLARPPGATTALHRHSRHDYGLRSRPQASLKNIDMNHSRAR